MTRFLVALALIAGCGDDPEVRSDAPVATNDAARDASPLPVGVAAPRS